MTLIHNYPDESSSTSGQSLSSFCSMKQQEVFLFLIGELGWHSGESARLPPMCPGFDSRTRRHMWVELVVDSCPSSEGFSRVLWFSSLLKNQHFQIPIRSGIRGPRVCQSKDCYVLPSLNKVNLFYFYLFSDSIHAKLFPSKDSPKLSQGPNFPKLSEGSRTLSKTSKENPTMLPSYLSKFNCS